jgi:membrane fusion protein (multidrug efflux system)
VTTSAENDASTIGTMRASLEGRPAIIGRRRPLRQRLRLPLMLAGPIAVLLVGVYWYLTGGRYVSTDDAYIQAARVQVSTDISGRVVEIDVTDNQKVYVGQVLFRLDPRPFRIAVDEAKAQLATVRFQIHALKATYHQKRADVRAAEATADYQEREFERQKRLLASGTASQQQFDQARQAYENGRQQLASKQQDVAVALANIGGDPDLPLEQHPMVQHAQAALDRTELNLSYAEIRAPENGIVTKVDQLQVGDYVTAGTQLFSLMSTEHVWVEANFKETELTHMRPGQEATVEVDTYPDVVFRAKVESLSPGTGLTFSLLPAENATGNWVKVVQRLPVRLHLERFDPNAPLNAGLSVTVEVDTRHRRQSLERVERMVAWLTGSTTRAAER